MVNFLIVLDSDDERRQSYITKIEPVLAPVQGLVNSSCSTEDFHAIWAAGDWTPVSYVADSGGAAIIYGDAIAGSGPARLSAEQLRHLWDGSKLGDALDGFHVSVVYNPQKGLIVGADLLGVFPVYHYASDEVVLVGSSPELFQYHPCFEAKFNPRGLVGILLTKGIVDGQTLFCRVQRLAPGHLLICRHGEPAKEVLQFELPVSGKYFDLTFSEQVEVLDQALSEAISRHLPKGERYCLMLSGGLDSRLLGGYLREKDLDVVAFTEGLETDNEMRCAIPVAHTLKFKQIPFDVGYNNYPYFAQLASKWEHLGAGFGGIYFWGFHPYVRQIARRVTAGYFATEILGGLFSHAIPGSSESASFETMFRYFNSLAVRPGTLRRLLKEEWFDDLVDDIPRKLKKDYESYSGSGFQRVWRYGLHQHARFHVGEVLWKLSFGSWPVLPFLDRKVLEIAGGMPFEGLMDRCTEKELLRRKFPELARLPLVAEIYDTTPLLPSLKQKALQQVIGNGGIWRYRSTRYLRHLLIVGLRGERRYYPRLWDINSPGWKALLKSAESHIELTSHFVNKDFVRKSMPSNSRYEKVKRILGRSGMMSTSGLRTLVGFALWLRGHQDAIQSSSSYQG